VFVTFVTHSRCLLCGEVFTQLKVQKLALAGKEKNATLVLVLVVYTKKRHHETGFGALAIFYF
jgi:hypothetical protein